MSNDQTETSPVDDEHEALAGVAHALSRVARSLEDEPDLDRTLEGIVAAVMPTVAGVQYAGISLIEDGKLRSVAPSDDLVGQVDAAQYAAGEGPCVDAIIEHDTFRTGHLGAETTRWPTFAPAGADLGIVSMVAFRLFTTSTTLGSLNLYSTERDAFDEDAEVTGELFATHAAVALAGIRKQSQLKTALQTRDVIATAKGILMQRHQRTDDQAFAMLVETSQHTNIKLHDVAAWVVDDANTTATSDGRPPGHSG
ncbi:GAF and ANTAR domain-containing protein [Amycolatopsis sp. NPDC058340]|uniref:GAF and ANTAR domain-containing protein n=1 Tax=Amycolatopsis sp. NPDC058340 TaxID=3346453 RepID=UPI003658536B